jgi:hypothetical protein
MGTNKEHKLSNRQLMHVNTRISDEWLAGATAGGYGVLTFVLHFWGSAFIHFWCGNAVGELFASDGRAPGALGILVPGLIVGVMDWGQVRLARSRRGVLGERAMRIALWMNLVGILGLLVAYASNYGPDGRDAFWWVLSLAGMVFWPVGLLVSLGNLLGGSIRFSC